MSDVASPVQLSGFVRSNLLQTSECNDDVTRALYAASCKLREDRALIHERNAVRWGVIAALIEPYWLEHLQRKAMRTMCLMFYKAKQRA